MSFSYPETLIELKPSKILPGQVGVFAATDLKKGTVVGDVRYLDEGQFVPWSRYEEMSSVNKKKIDAFCFGTTDGFTLPKDFNYLSVPWYINHSCDGNVGFDDVGNFVMISDVSAGDELTYDYGLAESNPRFSMECKCGSQNCRGVITGNDWKNKAFRTAHLDHLIPDLRNL